MQKCQTNNTRQKCVYYEQPEFTYNNVDLVFREVPKGASRWHDYYCRE